jgi:hypothetical protein
MKFSTMITLVSTASAAPTAVAAQCEMTKGMYYAY